MATGLSPNDVVSVDVVLSPLAIPTRNFGALLIVGSSDVIDVDERIRVYTTIEGVVEDFGSSAPEYTAAALFFGQSPQPSILYIGRWARVAAAGMLKGGSFAASSQTSTLSTLQAISTGSMKVTIDGTERTLSSLNFTAITNLNGAATVLDTALTSWADCVWDAVQARFVITSHTTGVLSTVSFASASGSGADVSSTLRLRADQGGDYMSTVIVGVAAESALTCVTTMGSISNDWYGLMFAPANNTQLDDDDYTGIAAYIEAASVRRIFGVCTDAAETIDPNDDTDIASILQALGYTRSFVQYCSTNIYAQASLYGRAFTVDFTANNTTLTLKFKREPGVVGERLTENQAAALTAKNCNVFVDYSNGATIIQQGCMVNGYFFDEVHGTDWLQNDIQTEIFNLLYQSPTKIPQTDAGMTSIVATITGSMQRGVNNGLIAPGQWNSDLTFGKLKSGDMLSTGYYIYAPPISSQAQSVREQRIAPTIQCAIKLAGAVHFVNVVVNVNR